MSYSDSDTSDCSFSSTSATVHRDPPPNFPSSDGLYHFGNGFQKRYTHLQRWRSSMDKPNALFEYCANGIIAIWHVIGEIQWKGPLEGIGEEWQREYQPCLELALSYKMWEDDWIKRAAERAKERETDRDGSEIREGEERRAWRQALEARDRGNDEDFERQVRGRLWVESQRIPSRDKSESDKKIKNEDNGVPIGSGHIQAFEPGEESKNGRNEVDHIRSLKIGANNCESGGFMISGLKW